jgi:protoporphyrinogen oxidase
MGLIKPEWATDCTVVRLPKAYPVYNLGYREPLDVITGYLARFANLYNIGRNATFLYTSSDHYIDMGLKAAENVLGHNHNLDEIGRDKGYAEAWDKGER